MKVSSPSISRTRRVGRYLPVAAVRLLVERVQPEPGEGPVAVRQGAEDSGVRGECGAFGRSLSAAAVQGLEHRRRLGAGLRDLGAGVGVAHQCRAHADPQPGARVDVGAADEYRGVHPPGADLVPADHGEHPAVVGAAVGLVPVDDPAGVLQRAARDGGHEHRLAQDLAHLQRGAPAEVVLGVGQPRHLPQVRSRRPDPGFTDARHHLQLFVDDHVQLVGLLGVREEAERLGDGGAMRQGSGRCR